MTSYITKYVKSCEVCGRHKVRRHKPYGELQSLPVPYRPWTELSMDFIGPLPTSNGMNAILVVVDRFTKGAHFIGTTTEATSAEVARMNHQRSHIQARTTENDRFRQGNGVSHPTFGGNSLKDSAFNQITRQHTTLRRTDKLNVSTKYSKTTLHSTRTTRWTTGLGSYPSPRWSTTIHPQQLPEYHLSRPITATT